ncbi:MAG: phosphoribosylformylglycinamidine synthase subunit PurQ [Planctomycetaceae bacterium]
MSIPKICVLRAPGTNCDLETAFAFERAGGRAERVHLFRLLERPSLLREYQILCIPGGFSYGDDVGAGVVFGNQLRVHLGAAVGEFLQSNKLALGICNGFQVLMKSGILPGPALGDSAVAGAAPQATLTWNENGRYTARWVGLSVNGSRSVFLRGIDRIELPIAHAEGRVAVRDRSLVETWRETGQLAIQYAAFRSIEPTMAAWNCSRFPANPNGSVADIAGLGDETGRVLGLMPHPERFIDATQHPQWTRRRLKGDGDGLRLFRNAVEYFA